MQEIEKYYKPERFELFVGSKSENNIHLYKKLGYRIFKTDKYECGNIELFYMEKKKLSGSCFEQALIKGEA